MKNAGKSLAFFIVMRTRRYDAGHIAQWSTSWASLEATGCHHWTSACIELLQQLPWSMILVENINYKKKLFLAS